jgi:AhpD family alkylhydroperoxidase
MTGIRYLQPVPSAAATGLVAAVYAQAGREFGLLPPIPLHSPIPDLLAGAWCVLRETLVAGRVERPVKEALAAAISRLNRCPYCVDAHTLMLAAAGRHGAARALATGKPESLADAHLRAIAEWGAAHRSPGSPVSVVLAEPPFAAADTGEMVGTAMAFHYINRMAHVFLPETPYPLQTPSWIKGWLRRFVAGRFTGLVTAHPAPGESLALLAAADLPADLPWAKANPTVAGAFARFARAVEAAVEGALPERVQERVVARLAAWDGADPGFGTAWAAWLAESLAGIPERERAAGRLALLTALASYRVDDTVVAAYRAEYPADRQLLGAVSWTSYVTARQVGQWLWESLPASHRAAGS